MTTDPGQSTQDAEEPSAADDTITAPDDAVWSTERAMTPDWPSSLQPGSDDAIEQDLRTGVHPGFERIVVEFSGDTVPGWFVEYVDEAILEGSGEELDLVGEAILKVDFATLVSFDGAPSLNGPHSPGGAELITDLYAQGLFEGHMTVFVAVSEQVPFRVFHLTSPTRIVVDLQSGG